MEVVEKKEMVHKDVYESGEKEYASKGVAGTGLGLGIAGTALGLLALSGRGLFGLGNTGSAAAVNAAVEPWRSKVTKMEIASVAGIVGLEAERRMCADNKIVNYANNTFYPIRVAAVEVGTDTVQRSLYNPLCPCAGYSNSILFEPTTTPAA